MNLNLTGHHLDITPAIRDYVVAKLDRVTRHFDHVIDVQVVMSVVRELTKVDPEVQGARVTAAVSDPALVPAVVRRLDDQGVILDELTLRGASLDEVFLTLTGHRAEEPEDDRDEEGVPA